MKNKFKLAIIASLIITTTISLTGYELYRLQPIGEKPSQKIIEISKNQSPTISPPPLIDTYETIQVKSENNLNIKVHTRESSDATANILLIHGAGGGAWVWEEYFESLPEKYNLYALSWRGHFTSDNVDDADSADYVQDQIAVFEKILSSSNLPNHIIGHSYGGATSVLMSAERPEKITSIHLLAPVVPLDYSFIQATLAPAIAPIFIKNTTKSVTDAIENNTGSTGNFVDMFVDKQQMERYWDLYAGKPYSIEKEGLISKDGVSLDWQKKLQNAYIETNKNNIPLWFLTARYDNVVKLSDQEKTSDKISAKIIEIESGHYIQLDTNYKQSIEIITNNLNKITN